jgi:hypothetical protein
MLPFAVLGAIILFNASHIHFCSNSIFTHHDVVPKTLGNRCLPSYYSSIHATLSSSTLASTCSPHNVDVSFAINLFIYFSVLEVCKNKD